MKASQRASKKQIFLAGLLAVVIGGLALMLALPRDYHTVSLEPARLLADTLGSYKTTSPVKLGESIILEAGAKFRVQGDDAANTDAETAEASPHAQPALLLTGATFTLDLAATQSGRDIPASDIRHGFSAGPMIKLVQSIGFKQLDITNAVIQIKRPGGKLKKIGRMTTQLQESKFSEGGLNIEGTLSHAGRTLSFNAVTEKTRDDDANLVNARIYDADFELALEGTLFKRGGLRINAPKTTIKTSDLKDLLVWLGMGPIEGKGLSTFEASGNAAWSGSSLAFEQATFLVDGNQATGRLSFYFDPRQPSIEGTLAFQNFNLSSYRADANNGAAQHVVRGMWTTIREHAAKNSLPFGLRNIDVDLRISTKSVVIDGQDVGRGAGVVICRDGALKADLVDLKLANGIQGRAHFEIDTKNYLPRYVMSGDFQRVDLGTISRDWVGRPIVDGVANITFDLSAQGHENSVFLRTLSGPVHIAAENGASLPINVANLFDQTKKSPNDGWHKFDGGFTALEDFTVELIFGNGILKTRSAKAHLDGNWLSVNGSIKLNDFVLDMVLTKLATSEDAANAPSARQGDALQLQGPISQPIIRVMREARRG